MKPGDPLVVAGYPATDLITKKEWSTERTPQIDPTAVFAPYLLWNQDLRNTGRTNVPNQGGICGGGVFDRHGRYVAMFLGNDANSRRDEFESAWPHLLKVKSKGAPTVLRRASSFWPGDKANAGVCVHTPPAGEDPIADGKDAKGNWEKTIYIELIVDGEIIE